MLAKEKAYERLGVLFPERSEYRAQPLANRSDRVMAIVPQALENTHV
jgi:hypothetical protein